MRDSIEEGVPRSSRSTCRKRRGELGSLQSIPESCFVIPRIVFYPRRFCTSCPGLDAGMLVLALCVRLLACLRSEEGAPRSTRSTIWKRRGELGRLQRIPETCFVIPRIVFACAIFAFPGLAWMRVCVCLRSVCGFRLGSEARKASPSSGASKACQGDVS